MNIRCYSRLLSSRLVVFVVMLTALSITASADDWPQWLGPRRDAVWRETGILDSFPSDGPNVVWRKKISSGYSGPAVADGKVFVTDRLTKAADPTAQQDDHYARRPGPGIERVLCFRESDGKLLWKHEYDCPYTIAYPAGPRSTPTFHQGKVYTLGAQGNLFCLDANTGEVIWSCDFKEQYNLKAATWGFAAHPLIDGEKLICIAGGKGTTALAFNKDTGKEIWRSLTSKQPGYSAPIIYTVGKTRQLFIWHGESINSLNPETGKVYWTVPIKTWSGMAIATPRLLGNYLFIMGFRYNSTMLYLGTEEQDAAVLWQGSKDVGVAGAISTPFLMNGFIYASGHDGMYRCVDMLTGKRIWSTYEPTTKVKKNRWANAFSVKNGERFFIANDEGDLIIANPTPGGYEEIDRCHILEPTGKTEGRKMVWSHPAFANKKIFARNDKEIVCISLAKE